MVRFVYITLMEVSMMHHTRKTHNAHNETQRRLAKLAFATKGNFTNPKYYRIIYLRYNVIWRYETSNDKYFTWFVAPRFHTSEKYRCDVLEQVLEANHHTFYKRKSKSSGPHSTWRYFKKLLHRRWRRKPLSELTFTKKDARGCSERDFW